MPAGLHKVVAFFFKKRAIIIFFGVETEFEVRNGPLLVLFSVINLLK